LFPSDIAEAFRHEYFREERFPRYRPATADQMHWEDKIIIGVKARRAREMIPLLNQHINDVTKKASTTQ